jgi:hypothetical protein
LLKGSGPSFIPQSLDVKNPSDDNVLKATSPLYGNMNELLTNDYNNIIRIAEGKRLILLDLEAQPKDNLTGLESSLVRGKNHGIIYSIEPSKGVIFYSDDELNLKIFIKELKN